MKKILLTLVYTFVLTQVFTQAPTASFSMTPPTEVCVGETVTFTDLSTTNGGPAIVSWTWSLGQSNTNVQNPTIVYTTPGTKTITLTVKNSSGQSSTATATLIVHPVPVAKYSVLVNTCQAPFQVTFSNQSSTGSQYSYEWNYGNGSTSTGSSPVNPQTYSTDGVYTATLTVTNTTTGCKTVYSDEIVVSTFVAGISAPSEVCQGETVSFEDNSTAGANVWSWTVTGPGAYSFVNSTSASSQNPFLTFASPGTYTVSLEVENTVSGCPKSTANFDIIVNPLPTADVTANILSTCPGGQQITFTISPYNSAYSYELDFGDGTPPVTTTGSGGDQIIKDFYEAGVYTVTLTVVDDNGCSTTITKTNYITIAEPIVDFSASIRKGCSPLIVDFTDMSTSFDNTGDPIVSWDWVFEGGTPGTSNIENPTNISFGQGRWDVTLTVTTQSGCTATVTKANYIRAGNTVDIELAVISPNEFCIKESIEFDASATLYNGLAYDAVDGSGNPIYDEDDIEFEWTFGEFSNNGQSNLENIIDYPMAIDTGWMDVKIKITFRGCETEETFANWVYIKPPKAQFVLSETNICNPNPASFPIRVDADASEGKHPDLNAGVDELDSFDHSAILGSADFSGNPYQFTDDIVVTWNWGDPASGAANTTVITTAQLNSSQAMFLANGSSFHNYSTYGEYVVTQTIVNNTTGCEDEITQTLYITKVEPEFSFSQDSVCLNRSLSFDAFDGTNLSTTTGPANTTLTYSWNLSTSANPSTSTLENPTATFITAGDNKVIDLTVTNSVGCSSSIQKTIDVLQLPVASTSGSPNTICANPDGSGVVNFINSSSTPSGIPIVLSSWNYGDGVSDNTGTHVYTTPKNDGPYNVTFSVTDKFGCIGTGSTQVEATWPIPDFFFNTAVPDVDVVCNQTPTQVTNSSEVATFNGNATYLWTGDPAISLPNSEDTYVTYNELTPDADHQEVNNLTLTVQDQNGCENSVTKQILVSLPQAIIIADSTKLGTSVNGLEGGCPPERWDFDGRSSLSISDSNIYPWNHNWNYLKVVNGDSISQNTSNSDLSGDTFFPGKYVIEYVFTDGYGCSDIAYKDFTVVGPAAAIAYVQSTDNCGQLITFTVLQDNPDFPITSLEIFFDDGNSITGTIDPACSCFEYTYQYKSSGTFNPYVETYGGDGSCPLPYYFDPVIIQPTGVNAGFVASATSVSLGQFVVFTDTSSSANPIDQWLWQFSTEGELSNTTGEDVKWAFSTSGEHDVVLTILSNGCYDTDTLTITVSLDLYIPNIFTPNNDGSNDAWYIPGSPFKTYELLVFNRWGTLMYEHSESTDGSEGGLHVSWDGKNNGKKLCSDGTYYYILKGSLLDDSPIESTGYITLTDGKE